MTVHLNLVNPTWYTGYSVLARASSTGGGATPDTYYALSMGNPWPNSTTGCDSTFALTKVVSGSATILASFPYPCHDGMTIGLIAKGTNLTAVIDGVYTQTFVDGGITSGQPGVAFDPVANSSITNVRIGAVDRTAPGAVSSGSLVSAASPSRVDLQWAAVSDDSGGSGILSYDVSRGGVSLGRTSSPQFTDDSVTPGTTVTYSVSAIDRHGNWSAASTKSVTAPSSGKDQRRIGVRGTGSYWGAAGEQIDLLSGNLNFSLPLLSAKSRAGLGVSIGLSYNSQIWRQENGASWKLGQDVGYGLGWRLQAGSLFPVMYNGSLVYCIFTDSTGAEYRLDQVGSSSLYTSKEGIYVTYDAAAQVLHFPDGS